MVIAWAIWSARNKVVFEGVLWPPSKVVEFGNNLWGDFDHRSNMFKTS